jgi:uncharacterized membrane-anchored protein
MDKDADLTPLLGLVSASLTADLLIAYAVTLMLGFAAIDPPGAPVPDPWFTILELLILCLAPVLVLLVAVVAAHAPAEARVFGLAALAFMAMSAALTSVVHFSILIRPVARVSRGSTMSSASAGPRWSTRSTFSPGTSSSHVP